MTACMHDEQAVLARVTAGLNRAGIAYMVTGSIALSVYAQPRMTRDVDLVVELRPGDADRFVALFERDFHCDLDRVRDAIARGTMFNLIHIGAVVKVDCIVRKDTPYRVEEFRRRRTMTVNGQPMFVVSAEDLVLSKLDWARDSRSEIQLRDVRQLLEAQPGLDWDYMKRWATVLGVSALLVEVAP